MKQTSSASIPSAVRVDAGDRAEARRRLRERRGALGPAQRAAADAAIAARLETLVAGLRVDALAAYWPLPGEPDLRGRLQAWSGAGIAILLPRVVAAGVPLAFERWHPGQALEAGPFGTFHPPASGAVQPPPALVLVPCLGFDARCYRLGYGGGFYDRTLAGLAGTPAAGVVYDACEVERFQPHAHDLPLDWVVTERRLLRRPDPPA